MKKSIIYIAGALALTLSFSACNDGFMERYPIKDISKESYWKTETDLKVYTNGFYNHFVGIKTMARAYGNDGNESARVAVHASAAQTDDFASKVAGHKKFVEISAGVDIVDTNPTVDTWNWEFLYRCNYFMENYNQAATVASEVREKYAAEAHLFRAWFYFTKVQQFGDVPIIKQVLDIESPELYGERNSRKEVMEFVMEDINKAIENLPASWTNNNDKHRVTRWTALALKSRIALYEGTYRKYHGLGDGAEFLQAAYDASDEIITKGPFQLYSTGKPNEDFRKLFLQESLLGNPEVILAREYQTPGLGHRLSGYLNRTEIGVTKDMADDFLSLDPDGVARPIALSKSFNDETPEQFFDNRDPRLAQTVLDPRQEQQILGSNSNIFPKLVGMGGNSTSVTGYLLIKFYDVVQDRKGFGNETNDYPLIRYAEVLLNHAEAAAELNKDPNSYLPKSINLLRQRVGMPDMLPNPPMDPKYQSEGISSLLVEIRRERRVELGIEDFRYQDLMRWKKGSALKKPVYGIRVFPADFEEGGRYYNARNHVAFKEINGKHYVDTYFNTPYSAEYRVFDENKHYLRPLEINVLAKNPLLKQNPGWEGSGK